MLYAHRVLSERPAIPPSLNVRKLFFWSRLVRQRL